MLRQKKIKYFSSFTILLLTSSELQAQVIAWGLANTQPIPISFTSMLILAGILGIFGFKFIKNNEKLIQKSPLIIALIGTALFAGLGISIDKAIAAITTISITTSAGSQNLVVNGTTRVTNNYSSAIKITGITTSHSCAIGANTCTVGTVLNPTESCEIATNSCDYTPPVITLVGNATIFVDILDPYIELGATASDNVDGDISGNIVISGDFVNTGIAGIYIVRYNVADVAGNNAVEVTRRVEVINP